MTANHRVDMRTAVVIVVGVLAVILIAVVFQALMLAHPAKDNAASGLFNCFTTDFDTRICEMEMPNGMPCVVILRGQNSNRHGISCDWDWRER